MNSMANHISTKMMKIQKMNKTLFEIDRDTSWAEFSPCRKFRFRLHRRWSNLHAPNMVAFIGANPSTANETKGDTTVNKCIHWAQMWGFDGMFMLNAFAHVQTNMDCDLSQKHVGDQNDFWIKETVDKSIKVVIAWGDLCEPWRHQQLLDMLKGKPLYCFGKIASGMPRHPSRIAYATPLVRFN